MYREYICRGCGSRNIEITAWINPNTNVIGDWQEEEECWCNDCKESTSYDEIAKDLQTMTEDDSFSFWSKKKPSLFTIKKEEGELRVYMNNREYPYAILPSDINDSKQAEEYINNLKED